MTPRKSNPKSNNKVMGRIKSKDYSPILYSPRNSDHHVKERKISRRTCDYEAKCRKEFWLQSA